MPLSGAAADDLAPGRVVALGAGVRRIVAPNPGRMTGPGTNTYLFGSREVVVLDPGPALGPHLDAISAALGTARLAAIAVTHTHLDHSPAAAPLALRHGAPLAGRMPRHAAGHDPSFVATLPIADGDRLACDAGALLAVATPGHASNHICWQHVPTRILYTGDHVLGTVSPVIMPPDGDMTEYLQSLARLATLDLAALAPGHGPVLAEPQRVIAALIRHRLEREARVAAALAAQGPVTLDALLPIVYADVAAELHDVARYSLLAHLIKLERDGRAGRAGSAWVAG